jgi:GNAT superfamily N-acetyltransferase
VTPSEQAAAHDANFAGVFATLARSVQHGFAERVSDVPVASLGLPVGFFNAAWPSAGTPPEAMVAAIARLRATDLPFVVHVPTDAPRLAVAAGEVGLEHGGRLPCFALEPRPVPEPPAELSIVRAGARNIEAFWQATEEGFDMPSSLVEMMYPPQMLEDPGIHAFVGHLGGAPIATSVSARTGDTVGIYSVATAPAARGRGVGTAMTWHLLRDADPGWTLAVLQASDMGRSIYERMGFTLVREYDEYVSPGR